MTTTQTTPAKTTSPLKWMAVTGRDGQPLLRGAAVSGWDLFENGMWLCRIERMPPDQGQRTDGKLCCWRTIRVEAGNLSKGQLKGLSRTCELAIQRLRDADLGSENTMAVSKARKSGRTLAILTAAKIEANIQEDQAQA